MSRTNKTSLTLPVDTLSMLSAVPNHSLVLLTDAPKYTILAATDGYLKTMFAKRDEVIGRGVFEVILDDPLRLNPAGAQNLKVSLQYVLEHKIEHCMAYQRYDVLNSQEGEYTFKVWRLLNKPVLGNNGNVQYVIHCVEDITDSVKMQEPMLQDKYRSIEDLNKATLDSSLDMIQVFEAVRNKEGKIVDFVWMLNNHISEQFYGDVIGKRLLEHNPGVVEEGIFEAFVRVVETGVPEQYERHYVHEQFDGWFYQSVVKLKDGVATTTTNITDRKKAEQELQQSKTLLQDVINAPHIGIAVYKAVRNDKGKIIDFVHEYINRASRRMLGGEDFTGKLFTAHGENALEQMPKFIEVIETGRANSYTREADLHGRKFWFSITNTPLDSERLVHTWEDVTERKKAEQEILRLKDEVAQKATDKYYSIFNSIDEGFCVYEVVYDTKGEPADLRWIEVNPSYEKQTGLKDVTGKTHSELSMATEKYWLDIYHQVITTGEAVHFENWDQPTQRWYRVSAASIPNAGSKQVAVTFEDITERRRRQEHQAYLIRLNDAIRPIADPLTIQAVAADLLGEHLNVNQAHYGERVGDFIYIRHAYANGLLPMTGKFRYEDFGKRLAEGCRSGKVQVCHDAATDPELSEEERQVLESINMAAYVAMPFVKDGEWVATLAVHSIEPRQWKTHEIELIKETAERTWAAVERAKAEDALRKSEEKYRTLFETMDEGFVQAEVIYDASGQPVDALYLEGNSAASRLTGISDYNGRLWSEVAPGAENYWLDIYDRVARTGIAERLERYAAPLQRWYDFYVSALVTSDGARRVTVLFQEITNRKRAEEELRENEARQRQLLSTYTQAIWETDAEGVVVKDSPSWRAYTGQTFDEWIDYGWVNAIHPDDREYAERQWREAVVSNKNVNAEFRLRRSSGDYHWTHVVATPLLDKAGQILKWVGMNIDIHERKRAEQELKSFAATLEEKVLQRTQELKESTALLEASANTSPLGMVVVKSIRNEQNDIIDFEYVWLNTVSQEMAGEDVIGLRMLQRYPHIKDIGLFDAYVEAVEQESRVDFEEYFPPTQRWFRWLGVKLEDGLFISVEDITTRKRAEQKIHEQAHFIEHVVSNVPDTVFIFDLAEQRNVFANPQVETLLGYTPAEMQAFGVGAIQRIIYLEDWNVQAGLLAALSTLEDGEVQESEYRVLHKDGTQRWVQARRAVFKRKTDGTVEQIIAILHDITQLKGAEQELIEERYFLEQVTDKTPLLIYVYDLEEQRFTYINKRVSQFIGRDQDYVIAMGPHLFQAILHPDDVPIRAGYISSLASLQHGEIREMEFRIWTGTAFRWFRSRDSIFLREDMMVKQVIGIAEDITYEKMAQEQAQKGKGHIGLN